MTRPSPCLGQVVRFEYLWANEALDGGFLGEKHRPCGVVVAKKNADGPDSLMVCAITHSEPRGSARGIELSSEDKKLAGLDDERGWVITSEVNLMPSDDLRIIRTQSGSWTYGAFSRELMQQVAQDIRAGIKSGSIDYVNRPQIDERERR